MKRFLFLLVFSIISLAKAQSYKEIDYLKNYLKYTKKLYISKDIRFGHKKGTCDIR